MGRRSNRKQPTAIETLHKAYRKVSNNAESAFKKSVLPPHHITYTEDQVVHQSRVLCRDFIYLKLRENSLLDKEVTDAVRLAKEDDKDDDMCNIKVPTDVAKEIIAMAAEFEQIYPHLFADIGNYLKITYQTGTQVQWTYNVAATEMFRKEVTWARVIALFSFTGALTVDCVKQGREKFANLIVDSMQKFVRERLAKWIVSQGGWPALLDHFHHYSNPRWHLWTAGSVGTIIGVMLAFIV